jgi:hypothetical protein
LRICCRYVTPDYFNLTQLRLCQVAIPVFDGLLDNNNNKIVLDLLFTLALWHGLAKLRLHTNHTLNDLDLVTTNLGRDLRRFAKKTGESFVTRELPAEHAARGRRKKRAGAPKSALSGPKIKKFNLQTYKLHALGDYTRTIRQFGTTDSYSTQVVSAQAFVKHPGSYLTQGELEHRRVKRYYARTNKNKWTRQIS